MHDSHDFYSENRHSENHDSENHDPEGHDSENHDSGLHSIAPLHGVRNTIEPSPAFAARVMRAVREEALQPPPIAFPWRRVAIGAAVGVASSAFVAASPALASRTEEAWTGIMSVSDAIDPLFLWTLGGALVLTLGSLQFVRWLVGRNG